MKERWRAIPGCAGYEVSDAGRVRGPEGKVHLVEENRAGWQVVAVRGERSDGQVRKRVFELHRLVAAVWLGEDGAVGHRNGDHKDNRAANLVACASEREAKAMSGRLRYVRGARSPLAKLRPAQVKRIRELRDRGWTIEELGERYGVAHQRVSQICRGEGWREA
jgi:hypothetical protein